MLACLVGSIVWHVRNAPCGKTLVGAGVLALTGVLVLAIQMLHPSAASNIWLDYFTSGLVLGAATTAMLMGHSYLIAPAMSMTPLLRLLALFAAALLARVGLAAVGLWQWTAQGQAPWNRS